MGKPGLIRQIKKGGKVPKWKPKPNAVKQYVKTALPTPLPDMETSDAV